MPLRRFPPHFPYADDDEYEEYDVYYFYPSLNALYHRPRLSSQWDDDTASDVSEGISPTYPCNTDFVFPDDANGRGGYSNMGYSKVFRMGFLAQSCRITRRLDAFVTRSIEKFRFLKKRIVHKLSRPT